MTRYTLTWSEEDVYKVEIEADSPEEAVESFMACSYMGSDITPLGHSGRQVLTVSLASASP